MTLGPIGRIVVGVAVLALPLRAAAADTPQAVAGILRADNDAVALSWGRAFPLKANGRDYVVVVLSNTTIPDARLKTDPDPMDLIVPRDMQGVILYLDAATKQMADGWAWHSGLITGNNDAADYPFKDEANLEVTRVDAQSVSGTLSTPSGTTFYNHTVELYVTFDLPVRPRAVTRPASPRPTPKRAPVKPH